MKKFTKVLASFCAMAMIFSVFSATVAAGEEASSVGSDEGVVLEEPAPEEPGDKNDLAEPGYAEPEEDQDKQEEEPENEQEAEKPAEQAPEQEAEQGGEQDSEKPAAKSGNVSGDSGDIESAVINLPFVPADNAPKKVLTATADTEPQELFANGRISQDDIDANGGKLPETPGSYYLIEDVTVTEGAVLNESDSSISINLDGYTIGYTGSESMYKVGLVTSKDTYSSGITLTIFDDSSDKTGKIFADRSNGYTGGGSVDNWINGNKIGPDSGEAGRGGCIQVEYKNTFILGSGEITGFYASEDGGGVFVSNGARFEMHGGKITDCSAAKGGGAVAVHASSNTNIAKGEFVMYGGEISGNTADFGGAIRCNRAALYLFGGVITNNTATGSQGGGAILSKQDKGVAPLVKLKGDIKIYGNTSSDSKKANLYVDSHTTVYLGGDLAAGAKICINGSNNTEIVTDNHDYSLSSFVCDNPGLSPYTNNDGNIKFAASMPKVAGYQLVIGGDIKLRAHLDLANYTNTKTSVSYTYSYTKGSRTVNVEKEIAFRDLTASGSNYTVDIHVESACITSPITITIKYSAGQVTGDTVTIEQYAKKIIHGDYKQEAKDVAWALLYFGSFAMMQFNINMNDPALRPDLEETDANINDPQPTVYTIGEGAPYTPASDPDGAFYGASVAFLSKTEVNLYFKKSVLGDTAPEMTVTYANGTTETVSGTLNGSNYYMYTVKGHTGDGFVATQFDTPFSFAVGNVSGDYSVNTYLQVMEYKYHGQSSNILLKLVEAYYDFAKKCQQL